MLAWLESASMAWAREMRGMASMASAVAPAEASARVVSGAPSGLRKPMRTVPEPSREISSLLGAATLATTAPLQTSSLIVAPASSKSASGRRAAAPAPGWTTTSWPLATRRLATSGTSATRRSRSAVSVGTPTFMGRGRLVNGHGDGPGERFELLARAAALGRDVRGRLPRGRAVARARRTCGGRGRRTARSRGDRRGGGRRVAGAAERRGRWRARGGRGGASAGRGAPRRAARGGSARRRGRRQRRARPLRRRGRRAGGDRRGRRPRVGRPAARAARLAELGGGARADGRAQRGRHGGGARRRAAGVGGGRRRARALRAALRRRHLVPRPRRDRARVASRRAARRRRDALHAGRLGRQRRRAAHRLPHRAAPAGALGRALGTDIATAAGRAVIREAAIAYLERRHAQSGSDRTWHEGAVLAYERTGLLSAEEAARWRARMTGPDNEPRQAPTPDVRTA